MTARRHSNSAEQLTKQSERIEASERSESFSIAAGEITRHVRLVSGETQSSRLPAVSVARGAQSDPGALWDKSFLAADSIPPWRAHRGHIVVVDLFSGVGGMSLGVREACRALGLGFEVACAVDREESALKTYSDNFGARSGVDLDLTGLSSLLGSTKTPVEVKLTRLVGQRPDVLVAGPPCQGHSNLNNHTRRNDPKNELYFKTVRAVELLRPKYVMIENVPTVTRDSRNVVGRSAEALRELGYSVDSGVVSLADIGVPQTRKRHILIAKLKRSSGVSEGRSILDGVTKKFRTSPRSLEWAIGDLLGKEGGSFFDELPESSEITKRRIKYLFDNEKFELPDRMRPDCHRDGEHTYQSVYGRMHWDRPAPTITSGFFTMGRGRFVHPKRPSVMTAHEAARVQFFPDSFDWTGQEKRTALALAIGNAVPPKLSYVFALEMLR